ncbi:MAG: hypothetical protein ACREXK_13800 [Gammaproteobacteria bacterium]
MKRNTLSKKLLVLVFWSWAFPINAANPGPPSRADIAKIYNIERTPAQTIDVRYYRKNECAPDDWCPIRGAGDYLKEADWLLTGKVSRADLALVYEGHRYREVLFWQQESSRSEFVPGHETCHFRVDRGGFLYAHPSGGTERGCTRILGRDVLVLPKGTVLFIASGEAETLVGILGGDSPVVVQHLKGKQQSVNVPAGYYARTLADGGITVAEFNLAEFYRTASLGRGLGPLPEDEAYVVRQEPAIQEILRRIREETLAALEEQAKSSMQPPQPLKSPLMPLPPTAPTRPVTPETTTIPPR